MAPPAQSHQHPPRPPRPPSLVGWRLVLVGLVVGVAVGLLSVPVSTHFAFARWSAKHDRIVAHERIIEGQPERFILLHERVPGYARWSIERVTETNTTRYAYEDLPRHTPPRVVTRALRDRHDVTLIETAGFPFSAAWSTAHASYHGRVMSPFERKIRLRAGSWSLLVPARPIVLGIVGNAIAYATPVIGVFVMLRVFLRWHRRRRTRCVCCGYDVSGGITVCPECGCSVVATGNKAR